jgi:hypothetical protein
LTPEDLHSCHRWFHLDELVALPGNPNLGNEASLVASVDVLGWFRGIVVHGGVVIAGNHRVELARARGEAGLPGYDLTPFPMDAARRMALSLVHNATSRSGVDDPDLLAAALGLVPADLAPALPGVAPSPLPPIPKQEGRGASVSDLRDGYLAADRRQLVLVFPAALRDRVAARLGELRRADETAADCLARVLGVPA